MLSWWHYLILCAIALAVTAALVPAVRSFAIKHGIVDEPGPRRVNKKPIPRLGGLAMFIGLLVALAVECILELTGIWSGPFTEDGTLNTRLFGVIIGFAFMVAVGALDDVYSLPPLVKFIGQIIAATIIVCTGTTLGSFKIPFTSSVVHLDAWTYPITVLYLVCFANVINLIDGLDGLSAGITGIASATLFILTMHLMRGDAASVAIILVGCCIGFLFYNFSPASIFMGDSGSLFLGLALGTISLLGASRFASVTALAVPIVIAGVPVIDTFSAIVRRLRGHQPIQVADAGHIHHRLLRRGFSQRKSVLIIYGWTALLCVAACIIWNLGGFLKYLVLVIVLLVSAFVVWHLGLFGPVLQHRYPGNASHPNMEDDADERQDS